MRVKVLVATLALCPMLAFAAGDDNGITRSDLASLKAKCTELLQNQQIKPFTSRVTCREVRYNWRPAQPTAGVLKNQREVGGAITMKTYAVPYSGADAVAADTAVSCPVFEKWKETVSGVDVELSCDQLQAIENLSQFCTPVIDERVQQDPSVIVAEKTQETLAACGSNVSFAASQQHQQQQKPPQE